MNILCNCLDLHALGNEKNAELGQLQVIYNCFCNRISFHFNIIAVNRTLLKMKQQQHDINFEEDSEKNPSPRWDLNPRPSVI